MRNLSMLALVLTSLAAQPVAAAEARIDITSPADGAKIKAGMPSQLAYEFNLGGEADHAHLYVDEKMVSLLRQKKGSQTIDPLMAGMHEICAKMVDKNHTPVGVERCIKITAE